MLFGISIPQIVIIVFAFSVIVGLFAAAAVDVIRQERTPTDGEE